MFWSFLDIERKIFRFPLESLRYGCQKLRGRCPWDHFGDFFIENLFFSFSSFSEILWAFCRKYFGNVFKKIHFTRPKNSFDEIFVFFFHKKKQNLLTVLSHWAKNCRSPAKKFLLQDCRNCNRSVYRKVLRIFLENLFIVRWNLSKYIGFFCKSFRYRCQNCILRVDGKFLGKHLRKNVYFCNHSWPLRKKNLGTWLNFSAELTKCIPSFLTVNLRKIVFSWKKCFFSTIFRPWAKKFGLSQNVFIGVVKVCILGVQRIFSKKLFNENFFFVSGPRALKYVAFVSEFQ